MDEKRFDELATVLASGTSRRRVVKLLGGGLATGLAASLGMRGTTEAKSASSCKTLCASLFPPGKQRNQCIKDGANGLGPCAAPVDKCAGVYCPPTNVPCQTNTCQQVDGSCQIQWNPGAQCILVDPNTNIGQYGTCSNSTPSICTVA